jgi:Icc-related predicted phosphoesterase
VTIKEERDSGEKDVTLKQKKKRKREIDSILNQAFRERREGEREIEINRGDCATKRVVRHLLA